MRIYCIPRPNEIKVSKEIIISGVVCTLMLVPATALASSGTAIDRLGNNVYYTLANLGKWCVVIKATLDIVSSVFNGEFAKVKSYFFQYAAMYALLLAFPWALTEIEGLFNEISAESLTGGR